MKFPDVAYGASVLPSPSAPSSSTTRTAFVTLKFILLAALFLIVCSLILSESIVSYPNWFISPNPSDLAEIEAKLQTLEWHARLHASALAFGAFVFVWYRIIIIGLQGLACLFGFESGHEHQVDRTKHILRICLSFLNGFIIINDSIFNRAREPELVASVIVSYFLGEPTSNALSPAASSPSYSTSTPMASAFAETIQNILPGAITRLTSMASRALPVCLAEVSILFLVLYGIGWVSHCCHRVHSDSGELNGNSQSQSHPSSNYDYSIPFAPTFFSSGPRDTKSTLESPSHNLCPPAVGEAIERSLQVRCHSNEKISLDLPLKADAL